MSLTEQQLRLLEIVRDLENESVALGGGAALIDAGLVSRPTRDLDFFSNDLAAIEPFVGRLLVSLASSGVDVEILRRSPGFVQLVANGVLVDVAHNYLAAEPIEGTIGPRCADSDIIGGKLEALFTRRVNRDVMDVAQLLDRYSAVELVQMARDRDAGFSVPITIDMTTGNNFDARQGFDESDYEAAKAKVLAALATL